MLWLHISILFVTELGSGFVFIDTTKERDMVRGEWGRAFKKCPRFKNQVLSCHGICKKVSV